MLNCLAVGAGGFVGAVGRYLLGLVPANLGGTTIGVICTTFAINVIGSFAIGLIAAVSSRQANFSPELLLFLKVGICGGFTTFSTFSLESLQLIESGAWGLAALYMVASIVVCVAAAFAGDAAGAALVKQ